LNYARELCNFSNLAVLSARLVPFWSLKSRGDYVVAPSFGKHRRVRLAPGQPKSRKAIWYRGIEWLRSEQSSNIHEMAAFIHRNN